MIRDTHIIIIIISISLLSSLLLLLLSLLLLSLLSLLLQHYQNSILRETYHRKLKYFKRTCKTKKYFYFQESLKEIKSVLHDSKAFWEKWKNFDDSVMNKALTNLPGEKAYNYFSELHKVNAEEIIHDSDPNEFPISQILNEPFTSKEF